MVLNNIPLIRPLLAMNFKDNSVYLASAGNQFTLFFCLFGFSRQLIFWENSAHSTSVCKQFAHSTLAGNQFWTKLCLFQITGQMIFENIPLIWHLSAMNFEDNFVYLASAGNQFALLFSLLGFSQQMKFEIILLIRHQLANNLLIRP